MRKTRHNGRVTTAVTQTAYRGHLLENSPFNNNVTISKEGFHLSYARSLDAAKTIVDQLLD
jgi:hypothetical protein